LGLKTNRESYGKPADIVNKRASFFGRQVVAGEGLPA
jgi:hypothetical protein